MITKLQKTTQTNSPLPYPYGPIKILTNYFKSKYTVLPPEMITGSTPTPITLTAARWYRDSHKWKFANDKNSTQLNAQNTITCLKPTEFPPNTTPVRLTMTNRYRWDEDSTIADRKARCSIHGDYIIIEMDEIWQLFAWKIFQGQKGRTVCTFGPSLTY